MIQGIRWRPRVGSFLGTWTRTLGWYAAAGATPPPPPPPVPPAQSVAPITRLQAIIGKAVDRSLLNDEQRSKVSNDTGAIIAHVNDVIQKLYADASRPVERELVERRDFLATEDTVQVSFVPAAPAPVFAWTPEFIWNGVRVATVEARELELGIAELPPAVVWNAGKIGPSIGRVGDPPLGAILIARGTVLPLPLTRVTDPIGATQLLYDGSGHTTGALNPDSSQWGNMYWLADSYLVEELALWFAVRSGDREPAELQVYQAAVTETYAKLMQFLRSRI